ncbi:MAG: hypothetical protein V2A53_05245 [bacterium]
MNYESPTVELLGDNEMNRVQGEFAAFPVWAFPAIIAVIAAFVGAVHTVMWYKVAISSR